MKRGVRKSRAAGGFTILEILVVVLIIGVLTALLLTAVSAVRESSIRAACMANLRTTASAFNAYRADHGVFISPDVQSLDYYGMVPEYMEAPLSCPLKNRYAPGSSRHWSYHINFFTAVNFPDIGSMPFDLSRIILFAECQTLFYSTTHLNHTTYERTTHDSTGLRQHRGGLNVMFADFSGAHLVPEGDAVYFSTTMGKEYPNWSNLSYHRTARPNGYIFHQTDILQFER